jgi:hypothetical protein
MLSTDSLAGHVLCKDGWVVVIGRQNQVP